MQIKSILLAITISCMFTQGAFAQPSRAQKALRLTEVESAIRDAEKKHLDSSAEWKEANEKLEAAKGKVTLLRSDFDSQLKGDRQYQTLSENAATAKREQESESEAYKAAEAKRRESSKEVSATSARLRTVKSRMSALNNTIMKDKARLKVLYGYIGKDGKYRATTDSKRPKLIKQLVSKINGDVTTLRGMVPEYNNLNAAAKSAKSDSSEATREASDARRKMLLAQKSRTTAESALKKLTITKTRVFEDSSDFVAANTELTKAEKDEAAARKSALVAFHKSTGYKSLASERDSLKRQLR